MYLGNWTCTEDMASDFGIDASVLEGATVIVAVYETPCYEGCAFVLFECGSKLYEVNASHCSCYGLEDQWQPEEISREVLASKRRTYWGDVDVQGHIVAYLERTA